MGTVGKFVKCVSALVIWIILNHQSFESTRNSAPFEIETSSLEMLWALYQFLKRLSTLDFPLKLTHLLDGVLALSNFVWKLFVIVLCVELFMVEVCSYLLIPICERLSRTDRENGVNSKLFVIWHSKHVCHFRVFQFPHPYSYFLIYFRCNSISKTKIWSSSQIYIDI